MLCKAIAELLVCCRHLPFVSQLLSLRPLIWRNRAQLFTWPPLTAGQLCPLVAGLVSTLLTSVSARTLRAGEGGSVHISAALSRFASVLWTGDSFLTEAAKSCCERDGNRTNRVCCLHEYY